MTRKVAAPLFLAAILAVLSLSTCSQPVGSNTSFNLASITASSGILTPSGIGTWTFDAGYVAQNTTDVVTFTVNNAGGADFTATGSASFANNDFALGIVGTFTVAAGSSNSFTGSFTPSGASTTVETGALTLTPSSGSPIVINLKGTSGAPSFLSVLDPTGAPIVSAAASVGYGTSSNTLTIENVRTGTSHSITLTGNPLVGISNMVDFTVNTQPASPTVAYGATETFILGDLNSNVATSVITISGQDSIAGLFFFVFTVTRSGG
ncbi:MAG: hypothetical protein ABSG21_12875 [Spirochaetia bacterium]